MMRLTFLGTGTSQGVPMIACRCPVCRSSDSRDRRLRSSVLVERGDTRIVVDAGPDFRCQMLHHGVNSLDAILLTHEHKDHTGGIDDVRAFNYFMGRPMDIYATERVQRDVRNVFGYAFEQHPYPGVPEIQLKTIDGAPFRVGEIDIVPVFGRHYTLPVTGFRFGPIAYLTDFNHIDKSETEKLHGLEYLIINALRPQKHISHFCLEEAIEVSRMVAPRHTLLTHVSHQAGLYADSESSLPAGVRYAYDGLSIQCED